MAIRTPDEQAAFDDVRPAADDAVQKVAETLCRQLYGLDWGELGFDHAQVRNLAAEAVATTRAHDAASPPGGTT